MAPRKRTRTSTATSPQPASSKQGTATPTAPSPAPSPANSGDGQQARDEAEATARLRADPWTDAEETALFRAVIRHKPTGLHKHMAMLNIYTTMLSQGYAREGLPTPPPTTTDRTSASNVDVEDRHISTRGIWRKLNELYDLDTLDEREQGGDFETAFGLRQSDEDEPEDWAEASEQSADEEAEPTWGREFRLPSSSSSRSGSPSAYMAFSSDDERAGKRIKREPGRTSWSQLRWSKRFPSISPSRSVSGVPSTTTSSPPPAAETTGTSTRRTGRHAARQRVERRDSSPPALPDLRPSRHDPPLASFRPSKALSEGRKSTGRDTGRAPETGKKGRPSLAASARSRTSDVGVAGRRRGRAPQTPEEDEEQEQEQEDEEDEESGDEEGDEDGSGGEGDEDGEDGSDEDVEEQATPVKKRRGRPPGRGRGGRATGRATTIASSGRRGRR